tara:strand:- start:367 stop:1839 length:1473 start_codon:yes stop_codon:yes gene_type:complete
MEASGVPAVLQYGLDQISGVSTNSFSIVSSSAGDEVSSGGRFTFLLPSVGLMDMKSSKINFSLKLVGNGSRLPKYTSSLIDQIVVRAGGVTISQSQSGLYGVWNTIQEETGQVKSNEIAGHRECNGTMDATGGILTANDAETYHTGIGGTTNLFEISLGEISECHPRLVDLSLLPQISIEVVLANNTVLAAPKDSTLNKGQANNACVVNAAGLGVWSMLRPKLQANMYSLMSGAYENALRSRMESTGFLQLCFPNTVAFSQQFTGSARFSIAAMSLNKLTTVFRQRKHATAGGLVPLLGYASHTAATPTMNSIGGCGEANGGIARWQQKSQQFMLPTILPDPDAAGSGVVNGAGLDSAGVAAISYSATGVDTPLNLQYSIQSALVPQYPVGQGEMMNLTCWANDIETLPDCRSYAEFFFNKCIFAFPLDLPSERHDRCAISGLSTIGSNAFITVNGSGANLNTNDFDCITFASTTAILRVGAGKSIELLT